MVIVFKKWLLSYCDSLKCTKAGLGEMWALQSAKTEDGVESERLGKWGWGRAWTQTQELQGCQLCPDKSEPGSFAWATVKQDNQSHLPD